ncbi:MAG: hypothetical protein ACRDEA_03775, partial [Microcystaceae cyanobacterium]
SEGGAKINIMSLKNIAGTVTGNSATTTVSTAAATDDASPTSALTFTVDNTNKAVNVIVTGTAAKTIYHTALVIVIPATNPNLLSVFDA